MRVFTLDSLNDIFDFFDLKKKHWHYTYGTPSHIFRGQGNSEWKLIASIFREGTKANNREQIESEYEVIYEFSNNLIRSGLYHPSNEIMSRIDFFDSLHYQNTLGRAETIWPNKEYLEILAIGQHYGIPTRLLDFTFDPYIALYFACSESTTADKLSVYSLPFEDSRFRTSRITRMNTIKNTKRYQVVESPTIFNQNMRAQKALFIGYIEENFKPNDEFKILSLEEFLQDSITKIEIPRKYCGEILFYLSKIGIDARSIFPGILGIAKYINNELPKMYGREYQAFEFSKK